MSFLAYWIISAAVCGLVLIGTECWEARHLSGYVGLSLANIALGLFLCIVPILSTIVAFFVVGFFLFEYAPKIVFFKPKDK